MISDSVESPESDSSDSFGFAASGLASVAASAAARAGLVLLDVLSAAAADELINSLGVGCVAADKGESGGDDFICGARHGEGASRTLVAHFLGEDGSVRFLVHEGLDGH